MSDGTAQRDPATGALLRDPKSGGIRRNAWTANAACCCKGSGHIPGSGSGSGIYCACDTAGHSYGNLTVTVTGSLNKSGCVENVNSRGGTNRFRGPANIIDPSIACTVCAVATSPSADGFCSWDAEAPVYHVDEYLLLPGTYTGQTTGGCPQQNPPCPTLPCFGPETWGIYLGKVQGVHINVATFYDLTGSGILYIAATVGLIGYDCHGVRFYEDGRITVVGQLPCGGTITMPFSNVASLYSNWGCFPPYGSDPIIAYTYSGTITLSDAGC